MALITCIASIKNATSTIAYGLITYYVKNNGNSTGSATVGVLPAPYYWWEAGAMWGGLVDYWHFTKDTTYNKITTQALLSQIGPNNDFMVPARTKDEGNDDQAFWGFALMNAAEKGYAEPPSGTPGWLQLTINLWNTQVRRWDTTSCNGGLKWQIFTFNAGYNYKNTVSNGAFFQLAARLARLTGNQTYVDWAEKSWDWTTRVGLIDSDYKVYDGTDDSINCTEIDHLQFSYNAGIYLYGAAVMYNYTNGSSVWQERTAGLLNATAIFFDPYGNATGIMAEVECEPTMLCNDDELSFKAYLSRFMWATTQMAPFTHGAVDTLLKSSAAAAAESCSGGTDGVTCGTKWYTDGWDGTFGVGQQLTALETIQGLLTDGTNPPIAGKNVHLQGVESSVSTAPVPSNTASATPSPTKKSESWQGKTVDTSIIILAVGGAIMLF
jgi:mannan endo-1,6-alpha-mannosidase